MPAPSWTNPQRWAELVAGTGCPLCTPGSGTGAVVADLRACYALVDETVPIRGYCCLVLKQHVIELHMLEPKQAQDFIADVQRTARAVQQITGAIKLNYEVHGNVVPHVHLHIIPRYPGDAIELTGGPWQSVHGAVYRAGEFARYARGLGEALR